MQREVRLPVDKQGRPNLSHFREPVDYYIKMYQASLDETPMIKGGSPTLRFKQRVHASWGFLAKGESSVPYLLTLVKHRNPDAREDSAYLLGEIGKAGNGLESLLVDRLQTEDDLVALTALIGTLGKIKAKSAIPQLSKLLEHPDGEIAEEAARSLGKITKQKFSKGQAGVTEAIAWVNSKPTENL